MPLQLMYITNHPTVAQIAEKNGVDRIIVDLEYIGKSDRQGGMDTVQSHHTLDDVKLISESIKTAELLVRVNPIHNASEEYMSSEDEIDAAIDNGADIIMLPFFKSYGEVERFIRVVDGRAKTMLLLETPEAVNIVDDLVKCSGTDYIHIGLNDLSIGYGKQFMFELLADGTVEELCMNISKSGIPYGFGGIASLGKGMIPAELIIKEHYRLGSTCAILSRSFCDTSKHIQPETINTIFANGIHEIRSFEQKCSLLSANEFEENRYRLVALVNKMGENRK